MYYFRGGIIAAQAFNLDFMKRYESGNRKPPDAEKMPFIYCYRQSRACR